jgi:hypothetical protein
MVRRTVSSSFDEASAGKAIAFGPLRRTPVMGHSAAGAPRLTDRNAVFQLSI